MIENISHDSVCEIRLARPPVNALDTDLLAAISREIGAAAADGASAIFLSGRPGMFSAGLDVPHLLTQTREQMLVFWREFFGAQQAIAASPVPIAAAITGHSPAGGAVLALHADYRVMAQATAAPAKYRIGLNEVQVGLFPGPIIYGALRRLVGPRHADRVMGGGLMLTAAEALEAGLVDRVVPEEQVVPAALEWARHLASLPPHALAQTRRMARADLVALTAGLGRQDYEAMNAAWFSDETQFTLRQLVERLKKN